MDKTFKALADGSRRKLLDLLLARDGRTLNELCAELSGMSRQAVSKHLGVLQRAKLVKVKTRGKERVHSLDATPIHEVSGKWMEKYRRADAAIKMKMEKK